MDSVSIHDSSVERFIDRLLDAFHADDGRSAEKEGEIRNVHRLVEQYKAVARGDLAAVLALMADDVEFQLVMPAEVPISGTWRGVAAVADAVQRNYGRLADQRAELLSVVAQGDLVTLVAEERGTIRATGQPYHLLWVQVYRFRGDKIAQVRGVGAQLPGGA